MFITIKNENMPTINTLINGPPRFLTTRMEVDTRDVTEKALAHYLREKNLTPKQFAKGEFRIGWLHHYLCLYDKRWIDIPPTEVKTTPPRTLVHNMNSYINRWKHNYKAVQKVIDELPEVKDATDEVDPTKDLDPTVSQHSSDDQEEVKG